MYSFATVSMQMMKAYDKDGGGIIDGVVSDYEVSSILGNDFKYAVKL